MYGSKRWRHFVIVNQTSTCPLVVIKNTALKAAMNSVILENLKIIKKC